MGLKYLTYIFMYIVTGDELTVRGERPLDLVFLERHFSAKPESFLALNAILKTSFWYPFVQKKRNSTQI